MNSKKRKRGKLDPRTTKWRRRLQNRRHANGSVDIQNVSDSGYDTTLSYTIHDLNVSDTVVIQVEEECPSKYLGAPIILAPATGMHLDATTILAPATGMPLDATTILAPATGVPLDASTTHTPASGMHLPDSRNHVPASLKPGGIVNVGNTCYAASALQVLCHMEAFYVGLSDHAHNEPCLACELKNLQVQLHSGKTVNPSKLFTFMRRNFFRGFFNDRQHDCPEFLSALLERLRGISDGVFGFYYRADRTCCECGEDTVSNYVKSNQLQLPLTSSVQSSVDEYFSKTVIKCKCHNCNKVTECVRRIVIDEVPKNLYVQLTRFKEDGSKDLRDVKVDEVITMEKEKYSLHSLVTHIGDDKDSGHYVAKILMTSRHGKQWLICDDSQVSYVSSNSSIAADQQHTAYILLYVKQETKSDDILTSPLSCSAPTYPSHSTPTSLNDGILEQKSGPSEGIYSPIEGTPSISPWQSVVDPSPSEEQNLSPLLSSSSIPTALNGYSSGLGKSESVEAPSDLRQIPFDTSAQQPSVNYKQDDCILDLQSPPRPRLKKKGKEKTPLHQKKNFRGISFNTQFITAVYYLFQYFMLEKLFGAPLKQVTKVRERVADALKISRRKVTDCVRKVKDSIEKNIPFSTPNKTRKRSRPKRDVDSFTKTVICNTINQLAQTGRLVTARYLLQVIRERQIDFYGSLTTLRKVVKELGYKYSRVNGRRVVCEKPSVAAKRTAFLRKYMELRERNFPFVFLDETWIFQKGSNNQRAWQNVDIRSCPVKSTSQGKRYIVLHAGGENGFIPGASLVFASSTTQGDYHGQMNGHNFMTWWFNFLDKLTEPTVIVMDNAPYHSIQAF